MADAAFTPGPWEWFGNAKNNEIYLATTHSGRRYVMGFERWGMRGAQPTFQPANRGLIPASQLCTFEVGNREVRGVEQGKADDSVYRLDINGIDCADARLIAAAPEMYEALHQYRNDLLYPVAPDSRDRRIAMIDALLAKTRGDA